MKELEIKKFKELTIRNLKEIEIKIQEAIKLKRRKKNEKNYRHMLVRDVKEEFGEDMKNALTGK